MEYLALAITLLAAILTFLAWNNGKWMKLSHQDTVDLLNKMDARLEKTDVILLKMDESLKFIQGTLHEIAKLVVVEGEKTRQTVRPS